MLSYESFRRYTRFLENHIVNFHIMGGENFSRQACLSKFFSLLFSDHFVSPVTDKLLLGRIKTKKE